MKYWTNIISYNTTISHSLDEMKWRSALESMKILYKWNCVFKHDEIVFMYQIYTTEKELKELQHLHISGIYYIPNSFKLSIINWLQDLCLFDPLI